MANVTVSVPVSNVTVDTTNSIVTVATTTSNITVGETAQVSNAAVRAAISVTDTGGDGSLAYNSTSGVITYTGVSASETRAHFSATTPITLASGVIGIDSAALFTGKTTDDLAEGSTNLYYTDARVQTKAANLTGNVTTTANVSGAYIIGDGSQLTNTGDHLTNAQVQAYIESNGLDATANISTSTDIIGDRGLFGSIYVGADGAWNDWSVSPAFGMTGNISRANYDTTGTGAWLWANILLDLANTNVSTLDLTATGNVSGTYIIGDGSVLTGVLSNAQAQAYIESNGLDATANISTTANISAANYSGDSIVVTGSANSSFTGLVTSSHATVGQNLTVGGNLEVTGNINYREVTDLLVQDQTITLNYGNASAQTSEIIVDRSGAGGGSNTDIKWNETSDIWEFSNDGSTYSPMPTSTTDLVEGTNLYYTTARSNTSIDAYTGAMINLTGNVSTSANITGNYILGDGSQLTNLGHLSNADVISYISANPLSVGGNLTVVGSESKFTGDILQVSGNTTVDYLGASTGGELRVLDSTIRLNALDASAASAEIEVYTGGVTAMPSLKWHNTNDQWEFSGILGTPQGKGNLSTRDGSINSGSGNITSGTGNIVGAYLHGDGSNITNIPGHLTNVQVQAYIESNGLDGTANITTSANISGTYIIGDGSALTNLPTQGDITEVVAGVGLSGGGTTGAVTVNLDPTITTATAISGGSLAYDNTSGVFTFAPADTQTDSEVRALVSVTTGTAVSGGSLAYASGTGIFTFAPSTGIDLTELSVATAAASGDGALVYDNTTGVFTFTPVVHTSGTEIVNGTSSVGIPVADSGVNIVVGSYTAGTFTTSGAALASEFDVQGNITAASNFIGDNVQGTGSNDYTINAKGNAIVKQEFIGTNTDVLTVDGKGYAFRPNNVNAANELLSYSGSDTMTTYLFNGTVTSGSADITVTSMNDKNGDASVEPTTGLAPYMVMTNAWRGTTMAPFPQGTYVLSVTGTMPTAVVTMSQNALASYTFDQNTFNPGLVDTTRTQAISVISDYAGGTGSSSNTTIAYQIPTNFDAYGYPASGYSVGDFSGFSHGISSEYTFAGSQEAYFRGKTDIMPANTTLNVRGLTVGENATLTGRGQNDSLSSFGINALWDGVTSTGYDSQIPQILLKSYTDKTLQSVSSGAYKQAAGPRLFLSSAYGNANDYDFDAYPRANYELGRIAFWGTTGDNISPTTVNPPAYISVQAADDWTTAGTVSAGNTNLFITGTSDKSLGADTIISYQSGELVLASGKTNGGSHESIVFAPAQQGGITPASNYSGNYAQWSTVNYADTATSSGSKLTITNGGSSGAGTVGDMELGVFRNDITNGGTTVSAESSYTLGTGTNFYTNLSAYGSDAPTILFGQYNNQVDLTGLVSGQLATFDNFTGDLGTEINGNSYYVKLTAQSGPSFYGQWLIGLFTTSALTTGITLTSANGNYDPAGTMEWTQAAEVTDREFKFRLSEQEEKLELITIDATPTTTSLIEFTEAITDFKNRVKLKSHTSAELVALEGSSTAGEVVYNSTASLVAYFDGTNWRNIAIGTIVT